MEEVGDSETNWFDESGEELVRELLDDETPFFVSPKVAESEQGVRQESIINKLISTVYSGPTISDIESALSVILQKAESNGRPGSQPIIPLHEKALGKVENKYTLRIRTSGNGLGDDGYKWRKYGQKSIKNSPNPRSYYRCTNPRCNAKKQVERSMEDPETLIVSYEGLHLHYAYSHFLLPRPQDYSTGDLHVSKKPKIQSMAQQAQSVKSPHVEPTTQIPSIMEQQQQPPALVGEGSPQQTLLECFGPSLIIGEEMSPQQYGFLEDFVQSPQGLLEDVVPFLVRNPCNSSSWNDLSLPSQASSPSYSSPFSWPPSSSFPDVGILSSII